MAIHQGLAGHRVRPDAEPTFIHEVCKQELKTYSGAQNKDQQPYVLKCDACDVIVGEWLTNAEMNHELTVWFEAHVRPAA